jgi:hypothetical protein
MKSMTDANKLRPGAALSGRPLAAPASASFTESPSGEKGAATPTKTSSYSVEAADIVAVGILCLAISASVIAIIVALGFVFGKTNGPDALKIITACVGGSTVSGIVAALAVRKRP